MIETSFDEIACGEDANKRSSVLEIFCNRLLDLRLTSFSKVSIVNFQISTIFVAAGRLNIALIACLLAMILAGSV